MSEFTFNIADYRALSAVRTQRNHDRSRVAKKQSGLVVLNSGSEPREYDAEWQNTRPAVVDIRSIQDAHRAGHLSFHIGYPRRGKILRFTKEIPERVSTMAASDPCRQSCNDPDPTNLPPSAA
jgi:hypothetical protein